MLAYVSAAPFADISVELTVTSYNASVKNAVNPSKGVTPTASQNKVAFSTKVNSGYLSFSCANETATTPTLTYKMTGTDLKSFKLSSTTVSITSKKAVAFNKDAKVTWAINADGSTAPVTAMKGKCPDMGSAFGWFAPVGTAAPAAASIATTARAAIALR